MDDTELNKRTRRFFFDDDGYGTAGTTTTTSLASQGGLLINIDSATGDIAQTASGWIEDERYGFYIREQATSTSAEFDSAVTRTGRLTLKMNTLDATGVARVFSAPLTNFTTAATNLANSKYFYPCKGSTTYKWSFWCKTNNCTTNGFQSLLQEMNSAGTPGTVRSMANVTGTNDWALLTTTFTTGASAVWLGIFFAVIAGNVADAWIDINSMTLEEVVEPVANSLVTPSPSLVSFTAVGSTGNIDQSQLTVNDARGVGGDGSTSTITNKIAQQFLPSKSKLTGIVIRKVADVGVFTGTITAKIVNDNAGVIGTTTLASITLSNATYQAIVNDTDYTLNLPCNLTAGTLYWLTIEASTSDALNYARIRVQAGNPYTGGIFQTFYSGAWNTVVFDMYLKTLYYKPTTNFKASQNNLSVSVPADEDGFLEAGKINFLTGQYTFDIREVPVLGTGLGYIFNNTVVTGVGGLIFDVLSGTEYQLRTSATTYVEGVLKVKIPGGLTNITINAFLRRAGASFSTDGIGYTTMLDNTGSSTAVAMNYTIPGPVTTLFIKLFSNSGAGVTAYYANSANPFTITGTVSVSSYSVLKNYPTNKDIIKQYSTTLGGPTTSATYRATKWGFPAIEYSATEYQFLDVDTTATGSTVAFSELGTTYTTVADGASLAISSTSNPNIFVKANITANRLYSSSNDFNASSDKDGSMRETVVYQVVQ